MSEVVARDDPPTVRVGLKSVPAVVPLVITGEHAAHRARQTAVPAEDHGTSDVFDDLFVGGSEYSPGGAE